MAQLRVTASLLNVRSGPGSQHAVLTRILEGAIVDQREVSADGRWMEVRVHLADASVIGWVSTAYVAPVADSADLADAIPWLLVAKREIGVAEYPGPDDNPRIQQYHATTTYGARDDEVPWCSSSMNWCMREAGIAGTRSAAARSWLTGVSLCRPRGAAAWSCSRAGRAPRRVTSRSSFSHGVHCTACSEGTSRIR